MFGLDTQILSAVVLGLGITGFVFLLYKMSKSKKSTKEWVNEIFIDSGIDVLTWVIGFLIFVEAIMAATAHDPNSTENSLNISVRFAQHFGLGIIGFFFMVNVPHYVGEWISEIIQTIKNKDFGLKRIGAFSYTSFITLIFVIGSLAFPYWNVEVVAKTFGEQQWMHQAFSNMLRAVFAPRMMYNDPIGSMSVSMFASFRVFQGHLILAFIEGLLIGRIAVNTAPQKSISVNNNSKNDSNNKDSLVDFTENIKSVIKVIDVSLINNSSKLNKVANRIADLIDSLDRGSLAKVTAHITLTATLLKEVTTSSEEKKRKVDESKEFLKDAGVNFTQSGKIISIKINGNTENF